MAGLSPRIKSPLEKAKDGARLLNWKPADENPWPSEWDAFTAFFDDGTLYISVERKLSNEAGAIIKMAREKKTGSVKPLFTQQNHLQELGHFLGRSRSSVEVVDTDGEALKAVKEIIMEGDRRGASDVHLTIRGNVMISRFRVNTLLESGETFEATFGDSIQNAAYEACDEREQTYNRMEPQAGRILVEQLNLNASVSSETVRCNWTNNSDGRELVLRLQPPLSKYGRLENLGYSDRHLQKFKYMRENSQGTFVATGPTGTGKTTLLAMLAATQYYDLEGEKKFKGFADPIEFVMPFDQVSVNAGYDKAAREAGYKKAFFAELRNDIDYAFYGEMRDYESIMAVLEFVDSGHFAWASSHATLPQRLIPKLADQNVTTKTLYDPSVISGVVGQRLLPILCDCARPAVKSEAHQDVVERLKAVNVPLEGVRARNKSGCKKCNRGTVGVEPVAEIIIFDEDIMACYRDGDYAGVSRYLKEMRVPSFADDVEARIVQGRIDPKMFEQSFRHIRPDSFREKDL